MQLCFSCAERSRCEQSNIPVEHFRKFMFLSQLIKPGAVEVIHSAYGNDLKNHRSDAQKVCDTFSATAPRCPYLVHFLK